MDTTYLLILFTSACIATWVFSILFYIFFTNKKRLLKNGYSPEYIAFLQKDYKIRLVGIAIAVPLLLLTAYSIYWILFGYPDAYNHLIYIFLIFLLLVLPFPIIDMRKSKQAYKKLALETNSEIMIDMKFKILNKFFNPILELVFLFFFLSYYFISSQVIPVFSFIHLLLPWLVYVTARNSKYQTKPSMKDGYTLLFSIITINFLIVLFYIYRYGIQCAECAGSVEKTSSIIISLLLISKIFYSSAGFINTRKFYAKDISKESQ